MDRIIKFKKSLSSAMLSLGFLCLTNYNFSQNAAVLDWVYQTYGVGNGLSQSIGDIVIDSDDNMYVSGAVGSGTVYLDKSQQIEYSIDAEDTIIGYIAKYNPNGDLIWFKKLKLAPRHMVIDNDGNLYTSGHFNIPIDFDPSPNEYIIEPSAREMYLAKYDNEGNFLWVKTTQTQGSSSTRVTDLAINSETNRITVSGTFWGSIDVNPDENESDILSTDGYQISHAYATTYDLDGEFIWATDFYVQNVTSTAREYYIEYDEFGNLFFCGQFADTLQLDDSNVIPPLVSFSNESEEQDVYIAKYNTGGSLDWIASIQGVSRNQCFGIKTKNDYVYVTGLINKDVTAYSSDRNDSVYFEYNFLTRPFIVKFDNFSGNVEWGLDFDVDNVLAWANNIDIDNAENVYISGAFIDNNGYIDFDPSSNEHKVFHNSGNQEAFLAKYTSEGDFAWAFSTPGGVFTEPRGLQVLSDDRVVLAGSYRGNVDVSGYGSGDSISSYFTSSINYHVFMGVYKQGLLSTKEVSVEQEITLFPNPATNKQTIDLSGYEGKKVKITLYDIQGRSHGVVYDGKLNDQNQTVEFDVSHLSSGFYLYDVRLETERRALRFIKQ